MCNVLNTIKNFSIRCWSTNCVKVYALNVSEPIISIVLELETYKNISFYEIIVISSYI